jgi:V/A-type H+-transporting ATPase subunit C
VSEVSVLLEEYRAGRDGMRYGFAVGKVRVLSTRLLDRATLERLVDAPHFAEQKRILSDTHYGRALEGAETPERIEAAVDEVLESAYRFLDEAGVPDAVVGFFRVRFDYANLKAALKARVLGVNVSGMLSDHGMVPSAAFEGPLERLPEPFATLATTLVEAVGEGGDGAALLSLDVDVDRALYAELAVLASRVRSGFLVALAAYLVDLANIKTLVRARRSGVSQAKLTEELLLEGGNVALGELARFFRMPEAEAWPALERRLRLRPESLTGSDDVSELDIALDNALVDAVRRGRRPEPGPEDVIAYVFAREAEAQVLRVALLGKMAGLDSVALHRRMRSSFR